MIKFAAMLLVGVSPSPNAKLNTMILTSNPFFLRSFLSLL